ncbi:MAG: PH domain-containing protein [Acidimicrobiales bacterium]|nr:PH domain-containing protein [Acidimicrobiales bacterium]
MAFSRKLLNDDEDIVLDLHPHWFFFVQPLAGLLASIVLGAYVLTRGDPPAAVELVAAVVVLVSLVWFGLTYARWATTNFVVTTDRLIYRHGVLAKHGIEIPLERVNTVFFSQSIFERMLGSGDLIIESAGEMGRQAFSNVRKPSAVQNEIHRQMEDNENRKFDRVGQAGDRAERSIPDQIEQLDDLRRRGVLTDAEFQAKKADLLDRM